MKIVDFYKKIFEYQSSGIWMIKPGLSMCKMEVIKVRDQEQLNHNGVILAGGSGTRLYTLTNWKSSLNTCMTILKKQQ